jgi:hypothetical protein
MDNTKILRMQKINRGWHLLERSLTEIQNLLPAKLKHKVVINSQYFFSLWVKILLINWTLNALKLWIRDSNLEVGKLKILTLNLGNTRRINIG